MLSGCSIIRRTSDINVDDRTNDTLSTDIILSHNISNSDFQIQKAVIEIDGEEGRQNLIANMKFKIPGNWLVSLRSQTGLEAARIYITEDTILVNDRINKILYHGSPEYLKIKYGITTKYLAAILGDFIVQNRKQQNINCDQSEFQIDEKAANESIEYIINCRSEKVKSIRTGNTRNNKEIKVEFSRFQKENIFYYAREILITDSENETYILIKLDKVVAFDDGEITFIPGKNYEDIVLR